MNQGVCGEGGVIYFEIITLIVDGSLLYGVSGKLGEVYMEAFGRGH